MWLTYAPMRHTLHPVASQEAVGQTRHLERPAVRVLHGQGGVLQGQDGVLQGQGQGGVRWAGGQVDAKADRGGAGWGTTGCTPSLCPSLLHCSKEKRNVRGAAAHVSAHLDA